MTQNQETAVKPPVVCQYSRFMTLCGRMFCDTDVTYFPSVEFHGRTIYLCTQACMDAFLADPEKFFKTHRNSEKTKGLIRKEDLQRVE